MRLLVDSLIGIMLILLLGGLLVHHRISQRESQQKDQVRQALAALHEKSLYFGAMASLKTPAAPVDGHGSDITPDWFRREGLPLNVMVPGRQPWLDVAPPGDEALHPSDPVIHAPHQAGFWYNPARGIFRARVTQQLSEQQTLDLYNELNGSALQNLPRGADQSRLPRQSLAASSIPATHSAVGAFVSAATRNDAVAAPTSQ